MEKSWEIWESARSARTSHDGDCKDIEKAAGNEKAMKVLRELLSSNPVSSDEDMTEEPSSSTSKERKRRTSREGNN